MFDQRFARQNRNWQRAFDRPHATIERQLADAENVNQIVFFGEIAVRAENSQRDRQIETRAFFAHVRRRKIDRDLLKRKKETAVCDCRANAFARFAHGGIRQADDRYR